MNFTSDNVLRDVAAAEGERSMLLSFFRANDFANATKLAARADLEKFGRWFVSSTGEEFCPARVTVSDLTAFRHWLRHDKQQAVKSVNRCIVSIRRYFDWLVEEGRLTANPAKAIKQIGEQPSGPRGLDRADVRKLLRHAELIGDVRGSAILHTFLFTGARCGEVAAARMDDLILGPRSGTLTIRAGKGNKQRIVPIPAPAREALRRYFALRADQHERLFHGKCGPLSARAVRMVIEKYAEQCGIAFSCHTLRHSFARSFLKQTNDLVSLASLLGHQNIQTTRSYCGPTQDEMAAQTELLAY